MVSQAREVTRAFLPLLSSQSRGSAPAVPALCAQLRSWTPLQTPRAVPARRLSGGAGAGAGEGGGKKAGMVDVQGGKVSDADRQEGHLVWAERAKNIVAAHRRFQLTTYNRLPEDHNDQESIHTDTQRQPVTGFLHKEKNYLAILLRSDLASHQQHKENVGRMATASVAIGHLDPVQLVPVFTRVGLMPPVVRIVGDLVPVETQYEDELRSTMGAGPQDGSLYWLEPGGIFIEDVFSDRTQVIDVNIYRYVQMDRQTDRQRQEGKTDKTHAHKTHAHTRCS